MVMLPSVVSEKEGTIGALFTFAVTCGAGGSGAFAAILR